MGENYGKLAMRLVKEALQPGLQQRRRATGWSCLDGTAPRSAGVAFGCRGVSDPASVPVG